MKNTKIMVAFIIATLLTWFLIGFVIYICSDASYKSCLTNMGVPYIMFLIGWLPGLFVGIDLDEKLNN